jgi:hypothetical protein
MWQHQFTKIAIKMTLHKKKYNNKIPSARIEKFFLSKNKTFCLYCGAVLDRRLVWSLIYLIIPTFYHHHSRAKNFKKRPRWEKNTGCRTKDTRSRKMLVLK